MSHVLGYGVQEWWYGRALKGLSPAAYTAVRDELPRRLAPRWAARMIRSGRDPVDALFDKVGKVAFPSVPHSRWRGLVGRWQRMEVALNTRLRAWVALVPVTQRGRILTALLGRIDPLPPLRIVRVDSALYPHYREVGKPDLVLEGRDTVVMEEMKVRGGASRHAYGPAQLLAYVELAQRAGHPRALHLILGPRGARDVFRPVGQWIDVSQRTGRVAVEADGLRALARGRWAERLRTKKGLADLRRTLRQMPIVWRSYEDLAVAARTAGRMRGRTADLADRMLQRLIEYASPA